MLRFEEYRESTRAHQVQSVPMAKPSACSSASPWHRPTRAPPLAYDIAY